MLSTVISNSCVLNGDDSNYGLPPNPRKKVKTRASFRHNPYSPYQKQVDTKVSLNEPTKIFSTNRRGQCDTMPVRHPRLHPSPRQLGMAQPRSNNRESTLPISQRTIQSQHKARQIRSAWNCSSFDNGSWHTKGPKPTNGKTTQKKSTLSSKTTGDIGRKKSSSNGRQCHRSFTKNGMCCRSLSNSKNKGNFVCDLISSLLDLKYSWILFVFTLCYLITWTTFAELYFLDAWLHGDMAHIQDPQWQPCFEKLDSFHSALSVSLDSKILNGFGSTRASANCMDGLILTMAQSIIESVLDALMLGCILAKLAKPETRLPFLQFSQHCVVAERDERMCLMFNVRTLKETHMLVAEIRVKLIKSHHTKEGEFIPLEQRELTLGMGPGAGVGGTRLFTAEPQAVEHVINEHSPLCGISADSLKQEPIEIVVMVDGVVPEPGRAFRMRTSYTEDEIIWGQSFQSFQRQREIGIGSNLKTSDNTHEVQTVTHSAEMAVRNRQEISKGHATHGIPSNRSRKKVHYQHLSDGILL